MCNLSYKKIPENNETRNSHIHEKGHLLYRSNYSVLFNVGDIVRVLM